MILFCFSYFWPFFSSSMMHQLRLLTHCDAGDDPLGNGLTKMGKEGFLSLCWQQATPVVKAVVKANGGVPCYYHLAATIK